MKKFLGIALTLILSICLVCVVAVSANSNVFTVTAGEVSGLAGSEVEVDFTTSNNTGFNSLEFRVNFDQTKLQIVSFEKKLPLPDDFIDNALNPQLNTANSQGKWKVSWEPNPKDDYSQNTVINYNGVIYTLKFKILDGVEPGTVIPITLTNEYACFDDMNLTEVDVAVANGSVTVKACDHADNTNELVETQAPNCTEVGKKTATCSVCGAALSEDIPVVEDAHAWGEWADSTPGFEERVCAHNSEHKESREKLVFTVTAGTTSGVATSEVEIDFTTSNNTGFNSLEFRVNFDQTKLQIVSFEKKLPLPDDYIDNALNPQLNTANSQGKWKVSWEPNPKDDYSQNTVITYNGVIYTLKFKILEGVEPGTVIPITITNDYACFDDDALTEVDVAVANGSITVDACDHAGNTNELVETQAPNCTEVGKKTATCSECGGTISEDIPVVADAHSYGDWTETTPGTCSAPSVETRVCAHNSEHKETRNGSINPDNHNYSDWTETTPGTCKTPSVETRVCSYDATHTETRNGALNPDNHDFGEWTETTPGNCTTPAVETRVCSRDASHTETRNGALVPDDHDFGAWTETTPGTCTTPSVETRTCSRNHEHKETRNGSINPDNHNFGEWAETTPGTCTTPSTETRVCSYDGSHTETRNGAINPDNHNYGEWNVTREPNCTDAGEKQRVCSYDPTHIDTAEVGIEADDHVWGEWNVTREPNCTDAGEKQRVCLHNAAHVDTAEVGIEADDHAWEDWTETTPGTCSTPSVETRVCSHNHDHKETRNGSINPDNHNYSDWTETTPGTCKTPSVETRVCSYDATHTETRNGALNPDNHDFGEWTETTPGNCTTPAVETRVCSRDASHTETRDGALNPDNHDFGAWTETTPGTCSTPAIETRVCSRDANHKETRNGALDPNNHAWGNWSPIAAGNCVTPSTEERVCSYDANHRETRNGAINPDLHDWNDWTVTPPTVDAEGQKSRSCKNDPNHVETIVLEKLGLSYKNDNETITILPDDNSFIPQNSKFDVIDVFEAATENELEDMKEWAKNKTGKDLASYVIVGFVDENNEAIEINKATMTITVPEVSGFENLKYYVVAMDSGAFIDVTDKIVDGVLTYNVEEYGVVDLVVTGDKVIADGGEGETPEGEQPEGETPEGETPEGEQPEGETPEGETPEEDVETPDDKNPQNGDNAAIPYILIATMLAAAAAMVIFKKKIKA